jgi:ProP effector
MLMVGVAKSTWRTHPSPTPQPARVLLACPAPVRASQKFRDPPLSVAEEELMTITKQDINAVLTRLTEAFPQAFVLEQYQPHRPLKVGIFSEIAARCPDIARSDLATVLNIYTRRMMYLQSLVAGAARVDLDGVPCGEVTAGDQEYAAARLAEIQAAREAKRAAAVSGTRTAKQAAAIAPVSVAKVSALMKKPVLRLPASQG